MNTKPKKWKDRTWLDINSGWQFRTFASKRNLQLALSICDMQGDGIFQMSIHLFKRALAFEFPFDGTKPYPHIDWTLLPRNKTNG